MFTFGEVFMFLCFYREIVHSISAALEMYYGSMTSVSIWERGEEVYLKTVVCKKMTDLVLDR